MTNSSFDDILTSRQALEALRNGVPNSAAVGILGCNQPQAESQFESLLNKAMDVDNPPANSLGMLVSGDFGSGKSHLLTHLQYKALEWGFVCSKVAISKETPLYDLGKVFTSAVENGRMKDLSGRLIEELGLALKTDSRPYANFSRWANQEGADGLLNEIFPASMMVYERLKDIAVQREIESLWGGDYQRKTGTIKGGLKQIGQQQSYRFNAPRAAEFFPQSLRFMVELIKGADYKGWVVLLDEIELVGSYSILQRGRSYAELARLLGQTVNEAYPGLVVVGTVTADFTSHVISPGGARNDHDYMGAKLKASRYSDITSRAEAGMRLMEQQMIQLKSPTEEDVNTTVKKLRQIYQVAYAWDAPPSQVKAGGVGDQGRMRYKVRAAINEWDLLRLYPDSKPEIVSDEFHYTYQEDPDLERESKDDDSNE